MSDLRFPSFSAIEETTLSESGAVTSGDVLEQATSPRAMMLEQRLDYYREHKAELWSGSVL